MFLVAEWFRSLAYQSVGPGFESRQWGFFFSKLRILILEWIMAFLNIIFKNVTMEF